MALKELKGKAISYWSIPKEFTKDHWISDYPKDCYVECHIDSTDGLDEFDNWIIKHFPELENETFYIHMD